MNMRLYVPLIDLEMIMKVEYNKYQIAKVNGTICDLSYFNLFFTFFYLYYQSPVAL